MNRDLSEQFQMIRTHKIVNASDVTQWVGIDTKQHAISFSLYYVIYSNRFDDRKR